MKNKFDVVIIGSGMGGLTAASILSQLAGKKVLLIEQHGKLGGFTHIFKRKKKYVWNVGVHYVGAMGEDDKPRAIMDYVTGGNVKWEKLPDTFEHINFPDFKFDVRKGKDNYKADLIKAFPAEEKAIVQYFKDMKKALRWFMKYNLLMTMSGSNSLFDSIKYLNSEFALQTTKEYMDEHFNDERLKAVLTARYGDHGLPPHMSSFVIHCIIQNHYFDGGYTPSGTSKSIADSVLPIIENAGGTSLTSHMVTDIIVENGKAVGIKAFNKKNKDEGVKEFYADLVISNAGAEVTYNKLLPTVYAIDQIKELNKIKHWVSNITLFIGLKDNPEKLGFKGENHWIHTKTDLVDEFKERNDIVDGKVNAGYLSFTKHKITEEAAYTAQLLTFSDYDPFREWEELPFKQRGDDYEALKQKIVDSMIKFVDDRYPGFKDLVDYTELGTPLTTKHYLNYEKGNIYGIPATPERYKMKSANYRTPVKNLYLTGADTAGHGITGAMMSGIMVSAIVMGLPLSLMKIFRTAIKFSKSLKD